MEELQVPHATSNGTGFYNGYGLGNSNGNGYGRGDGNGSGNGHGHGYGNGSGNGSGYGSGHGDGNLNLHLLFPIPDEYHYLLNNQTIIQQVKIRYDLHNASTQEEIDLLVEWYETVQEIDKAK